MRILITGSNGLLGRHLYTRLKLEGHQLFCLDRKYPTTPLPNYICHDIRHSLPRLGMDWIFNLAGTPSPSLHRKNTIHTGMTNTVGMYNVLDFAVRNKARVFQASTIDVTTRFDPQNPSSCYYEGKRMAETILYDYKRVYELDIRVGRMGNFYGPGCNLLDGHVIPTFIRNALEGKDIVIFGTGSQMRNFCYVTDIVEFILLLMNSDLEHPVYAVGNDLISIKDLAELIIKLTNSDSKIQFTNNIELRERRDVEPEPLGWKPKVGLIEGLTHTIGYFREGLYEQDAKENYFHISHGWLGARDL